MSKKYHELMSLTDEELIKLYDAVANNTVVGLSYYIEELARRRTEKSNKLMAKLTIWIAILTAVMLLSTIANVIVTVMK
jgi:cytoskeletal protein RodZ